MNPCQLTMSVTALANSIACDLSDEDLELAAAIFSQLGDTLATIAVQRARCTKEEQSCETGSKGG